MKRTILLNPGPVTTTETVKKALLVEDICHREEQFTFILRDIREKLLHLAGADAQYSCVLFASSGTGAVEACLSSLVPHHKAIAVINNGAYGQRMIDIAKCYHIPVLELTYTPEEPLPLADIEEIIAAHPEVAYVAMVHHETSSGLLNPLKAMGDLCRRQGCGFILDAMSSFAGTKIHVIRDQVDFLISSANKCIQGMPGLAFVIGKKKELIASKAWRRSYYFNLYQQFESLESTGQMSFTAPVQVVYALQQALDELIEETIPKRMERYHHHYDHLVAGLTGLGFRVLTPCDRASKLLAMVSLPKDLIHLTFLDLHAMLLSHGITIYPPKNIAAHGFRVACMGDLTSDDIDYFLEVLSTVLFKIDTI